jgi:hypothetical protein
MGTSRPLIGREVRGRGPPAQPTGGRFQTFFFTNKKFFLFAKRPLRHPARPLGGRFLIFAFLILVYYFWFFDFGLFLVFDFGLFLVFDGYGF